ncbi:hypothetical protein ACFYU5_18935 [Nocardia aobensis]|uniref:Uncharacterized protein n=1 Tax=Nocardia aobensis TaxID=257277 RepID=A0ABW6P5Q9_9NOCA
MPIPGDLRIWYIPQIPMKAYYRDITSVEEGRNLLDAIYELALFEFHNNVKPDYSNAGGIERWEEDGEGGYSWCTVDEDEMDW